MNSRDLFIGFNEVEDDILERSEQATVFNGIPVRRRLSIVLIAAILALFLLGAAAVTGLLGDSIQSWFAHYWETLTSQPMSDEHSALIDHLSQEIGLSETTAGVTVTVDSATVGEESFFILLRVEGLEFFKKHQYGFDEAQVKLSQESVGDIMGAASYSYNYLGLDAERSALFLIKFDYAAKDTDQEDKHSYQVSLSMTNFVQDPRTNERMLLTEGSWNFTISLDRNMLETQKLQDTWVGAIDYSGKNGLSETQVLLTDMELTNTSFHFRYNWRDGDVVADIELKQVRVVLSNGREVGVTGSSGIKQNNGQWHCAYFWEIPVDLDEVVAIKIGEVVIPVE